MSNLYINYSTTCFKDIFLVMPNYNRLVKMSTILYECESFLVNIMKSIIIINH